MSGLRYARIAAWQPLDCKARPLKRVSDNNIIQERAILLPDLVLVRDHLLLDFIRELCMYVSSVACARQQATVTLAH